MSGELAQALLAVVDERVEPRLPGNEAAFVDLLVRHGIAGLGWRLTRHLRWRHAGARDQLRAARTEAAHRHIVAVSTLTRVAALLDELGIEWATFKGPVLAEHLHVEASDRSYSDVDVLVGPENLSCSVEALESAGFELLDRNWQLLSSRMLGELHLVSPDGVVVDLHWSLVNRPEVRARFNFDTTETLGRRREVWLAGTPVSTLSATDTAVHLATHAALAGGHRLVWCLDVARATDPSLVRAGRVAERARQVRAGGAVAAMAARSAAVTGNTRSELTRALGHRLLARGAARVHPRWAEPDHGGPARWLLRAASAGGVSTAPRLASEFLTALRRSTMSGRGFPSVLTPRGSRNDRDLFMARVAATSGRPVARLDGERGQSRHVLDSEDHR